LKQGSRQHPPEAPSDGLAAPDAVSDKKPKKKSGQSPTQLSLKSVRADGWTANVVERWNMFARVRQDLFGFIDIVAVKPGQPILGIQTTSRTNMSARINKIMEIQSAKDWSSSGRILVHGWDKKDGRWRCKSVALEWDAFNEAWSQVEQRDEDD